MQSLALDIPLQTYSCLLFSAAMTDSYGFFFKEKNMLSRRPLSQVRFFSSENWERKLPLLRSGSSLRGMWSQSFSGGAASAVILPLSYVQPEGYVPTLTQEHQHISVPKGVVRGQSRIRTLLLWGWPPPQWTSVLLEFTAWTSFPIDALKIKYTCNKPAAAPGRDSFLPLTCEWQNKERHPVSSLMSVPSTLTAKHRESQMKASCRAHWIILLSNTSFTHASGELKADGFGCSSPACGVIPVIPGNPPQMNSPHKLRLHQQRVTAFKLREGGMFWQRLT